jgi:hypothetical protein
LRGTAYDGYRHAQRHGLARIFFDARMNNLAWVIAFFKFEV